MILRAHTYFYHIVFEISTYDILSTDCSQGYKAGITPQHYRAWRIYEVGGFR
jgi:hypothetical protein